jgi:hypothetical protein
MEALDGDREGLDRLAAHHETMTRHFQHERLIHLMVTLFFGALLVGAVTGLLIYLVNAQATGGWTLGGLTALAVVLCALEGAYIAHYYGLENNVQALSRLSIALFEAQEPQHTQTRPGADPGEESAD